MRLERRRRRWRSRRSAPACHRRRESERWRCLWGTPDRGCRATRTGGGSLGPGNRSKRIAVDRTQPNREQLCALTARSHGRNRDPAPIRWRSRALQPSSSPEQRDRESHDRRIGRDAGARPHEREREHRDGGASRCERERRQPSHAGRAPRRLRRSPPSVPPARRPARHARRRPTAAAAARPCEGSGGAGATPLAASLRQLRPVRFLRDDRAQDVGGGFAVERARRGEHVEEHAAQRPQIGASIDRASARLLGRHLRGGAEDDARLRHRGGRGRWQARRVGRRPGAFGAERFGQTEVEDLHAAIARHVDVGRL